MVMGDGNGPAAAAQESEKRWRLFFRAFLRALVLWLK